jgi:hypothetical protein
MQNPDPVHQWEKSRQFMDFTLLPGATIGGQPMWALEGRWKQGAITNAAMSQQAASVGKIRLHIGQQDGFSHRVEQFDKEGARPVVTVDLSKVKFNEPLDDAKFQYKPPPGIEAIDVTDMTAEFMRQGGPTPPPAPAGKP